MDIRRGTILYFTTPWDSAERNGVVQEVTSLGYRIGNVWYSKNEIQIKNVLLDSRSNNNADLILG